jgi:hypothetical protein
MSDDRKTHRIDVQITRTNCDWNNLAWQTIENMTGLKAVPPPENCLEDAVRFLLSRDVDWGAHFSRHALRPTRSRCLA